jgi:hypothetical protein
VVLVAERGGGRGDVDADDGKEEEAEREGGLRTRGDVGGELMGEVTGDMADDDEGADESVVAVEDEESLV